VAVAQHAADIGIGIDGSFFWHSEAGRRPSFHGLSCMERLCKGLWQDAFMIYLLLMIKRLVIAFLFTLSVYAPQAFAQTVNAPTILELKALIEQLYNQIKVLEAQVKLLKADVDVSKKEIAAVKEEIRFSQFLRKGDEGRRS